MLTFLLLILIVIGVTLGLVAGGAILAFSPILLIVLAFIALDVLVFKLIFKRKKKK